MLEADKRRLLDALKRQGISNNRVLKALEAVPRELFVPAGQRQLSYHDHPLPIGWGQTISQPFTVAYMAQLLDIQEGDRILEIGCGSGYNAAVLQEITGETGQVFSIERIPELVQLAQEHLKDAGYHQITVTEADGKQGLSDHAPFDRIMVTAQGAQIPPAFVRDLQAGGVLVMPVSSGNSARMVRLMKKTGGDHEVTSHGAFFFVPLV